MARLQGRVEKLETKVSQLQQLSLSGKELSLEEKLLWIMQHCRSPHLKPDKPPPFPESPFLVFLEAAKTGLIDKLGRQLGLLPASEPDEEPGEKLSLPEKDETA